MKRDIVEGVCAPQLPHLKPGEVKTVTGVVCIDEVLTE